MVFIHGESFAWNAGNPYDGRVLSSYGNVIVVTMNYRLGVLGFLPSVDRSYRGNYGLMDQVAALHWIQDNIAEFGGDHNNVTIFGQGHGAACVNLLMLSPMAKGLFHRAIMQSGSALCPWAIAKNVIAHTQVLADALNCSTKDSMTLIECLRKVKLEDIMAVDIQTPRHLSSFGPTVDGIVLPHDPVHLMQTKPDLFLRYDLMLGAVKVESDSDFSSQDELHGINTGKRDRVLRTMVRNLYKHHLQQIFLTVVNEYMDWSLPYLHNSDILRGTLDALTDVTVVSPVLKTGMLHSNPSFPVNSPVYNPAYYMPKKTYFYIFGHQTESGVHSSMGGCVAGEDLSYVFGAPMVGSLGHFPSNYTLDEMALSEVTLMHWTSFAKFGDPNIATQLGDLQLDVTRGRYERVIWPEFTANHQKYLSISLKPTVKDHYNAHRLSYWLNLIPQLDTADNTTTELHHMLEDHHNLSSYDGVVRDLYMDIQQWTSWRKNEDSGSPNSSADEKLEKANVTDIHVYGLDQEGQFSALGITIAIGCSLLMLNAVVFAGIYYQKDKSNVAKKVQKAFYEQVEKNRSDEDIQSFNKPYLLKEAASSLLVSEPGAYLHDFEPLQSFGKDQQIFDLVEHSEIERQLSKAEMQMLNKAEIQLQLNKSDINRQMNKAEIQLQLSKADIMNEEAELGGTLSRQKSGKGKSVTFVEVPTILCDCPDPVVPDSSGMICLEQIALRPLQTSESVNNDSR